MNGEGSIKKELWPSLCWLSVCGKLQKNSVRIAITRPKFGTRDLSNTKREC